jgi:glycosyltransferase involved in cell wall biosynthesis
VRRGIGEVANGIWKLRLLHEDRPDVIVATVPSLALAPVGLLAAVSSGARFVLDVRDLYWLYAAELGKAPMGVVRVAERVIASVAARAEAVTATTAEQVEYLRCIAPVLNRTSRVVPNGVEDEFFRWFDTRQVKVAAPRLRVVYAGLLGYAQGLGALIEAAARLNPDTWEVVIGGDGPERDRLESRVAELGLTHVRFVGYLDANALRRLYLESDVLYAQLRDLSVMGTAQPTKIMEYMATGRPIVYGGRGAAARLVQKSGGGLVVPADDPAAIVGALETLRSQDQRRRLAESGRAFVGRYLLRSHTLPGFIEAVLGA